MRNDLIDALKGVAILVVVAGHSLILTYGRVDSFARYLDAFILQLFVYLSGWVVFYGKKSIDHRWLADKAGRLFIPFLVWSSALYLLDKLGLSVLVSHLDFSGSFGAYFARIILNPVSGLWFLLVLFFIYLMFYIFLATVKPRQTYLRDAALVLGGLLIYALPADGISGFPAAKMFFIYFVLGYLANKYRDRLTGLVSLARFAGPVSLVLFPVLAYCWNRDNLLPFGFHGNWLLFKAYLLITGIAGITFAHFLVGLLRKTPLYPALVRLGVLSLEIYAAHHLFLNLGIGSGLPQFFTIFASTLVLTLVAIRLIKRSPTLSRLLFGATSPTSPVPPVPGWWGMGNKT